MLGIIMFCSFMTLFLLIISFNTLFMDSRFLIKQRLSSIAKDKLTPASSGELENPFHSRVIQPLLHKVSHFLHGITPTYMITRYEKAIVSAGNPYQFGVNEWLLLQAIIGFLLPFLTIVMGVVFKALIMRIISIVILELLLVMIAPTMILNSKAQERQKAITNALPDIIDLITVSVEAGLSFDAALDKVVEKVPGVLGKEFEKTLQEIRIGKPRRDALRNMSTRIGVDDFSAVIAAIVQADQLGVSIGNVMRIQSEQMRTKRRQRAQEKAMKAPIKMLIPMVLFIFPTIFIVILGPMVIQIIDVFKK